MPLSVQALGHGEFVNALVRAMQGGQSASAVMGSLDPQSQAEARGVWGESFGALPSSTPSSRPFGQPGQTGQTTLLPDATSVGTANWGPTGPPPAPVDPNVPGSAERWIYYLTRGWLGEEPTSQDLSYFTPLLYAGKQPFSQTLPTVFGPLETAPFTPDDLTSYMQELHWRRFNDQNKPSEFGVPSSINPYTIPGWPNRPNSDPTAPYTPVNVVDYYTGDFQS